MDGISSNEPSSVAPPFAGRGFWHPPTGGDLLWKRSRCHGGVGWACAWTLLYCIPTHFSISFISFSFFVTLSLKPNIHVGSFSLAMAVGKSEAFIPIKGTFITPHAQRERGKVIGRGVHIYIYIYICL